MTLVYSIIAALHTKCWHTPSCKSLAHLQGLAPLALQGFLVLVRGCAAAAQQHAAAQQLVQPVLFAAVLPPSAAAALGAVAASDASAAAVVPSALVAAL